MKRFASFLLFLSLAFTALTSFAHSGRTDFSGGHYNRKTGEYHYHNGGHRSTLPVTRETFDTYGTKKCLTPP